MIATLQAPFLLPQPWSHSILAFKLSIFAKLSGRSKVSAALHVQSDLGSEYFWLIFKWNFTEADEELSVTLPLTDFFEDALLLELETALLEDDEDDFG